MKPLVLENAFSRCYLVGSRGWLGTEFAKALIAGDVDGSSVSFYGSRESVIQIHSKAIPVKAFSHFHGAFESESLLIFNSFLKREYVSVLGSEAYKRLSLQLIEHFTERVRSSRSLVIINISSGVANSEYYDSSDEYAVLKRIAENSIAEACRETESVLINCRLYSLTGVGINEFNRLAISNMVLQSLNGKNILVETPRSLRSYVLDSDLVKLLLRLCNEKQNYHLETGGVLVNFEQLAKGIGDYFGDCDISVNERGFSNDYYGDVPGFQSICDRLGIPIAPLKEQLMYTIPTIIRNLKTTR